MDFNIKIILSLLLLISAGLVLYPQINDYLQLVRNFNFSNALQPAGQIIGFSLLFFIAFCVIWAIPETNTKKPKTKTEEMLEEGFVFNVETGKWEKSKA